MPERSATTPSTSRTDKRAAILDAGTHAFLANGFDQTSMDAVAASAGVSKTTVYAHFRDKIGLFRAVLERSATSLDVDLDQVVLDKSNSPEEKLVKALVALSEAFMADAFQAYLRIVVSESRRRPELTRILPERGEPYAVTVMAAILLEDGAQQGYRLPTPNAYAALLLRMATASLQLDGLLEDRFRPDHTFLEHHARAVTRLFLNGLRPHRESGADQQPAMIDYSYPWIPIGPD